MLGQHLPRYDVQPFTPAGCYVPHIILAQLLWQARKQAALHWGPMDITAHRMTHALCSASGHDRTADAGANVRETPRPSVRARSTCPMGHPNPQYMADREQAGTLHNACRLAKPHLSGGTAVCRARSRASCHLCRLRLPTVAALTQGPSSPARGLVRVHLRPPHRQLCPVDACL